MNWIDALGFAAALCTTAAFVPQAWKVHRTRHTRDLSIMMFGFACLGIFLWLIYGIIIMAWPVICANAVSIILALYILIMKIKHG